MNIEKAVKIIAWFGVAAITLTIIGVWIPNQEEVQRANGYKLDNCVKYANEVGIGPNDNGRAEFIKNCFDK